MYILYLIKLIERLLQRLNAALKNLNFMEARLLVRFFSDLVNANVLDPASLVAMFDMLLAVVEEPKVVHLFFFLLTAII